MDLHKTEQRNPNSMNFDKLSTMEMAKLIICANYDAVRAVEEACESISKAIDAVAAAFEKGGRLFYVGAGTSGRLGVIDASECPPTFGVSYEQVQGIIAGGKERMFSAAENAEDKYDNGCADVAQKNVNSNDVVVGISAAGNASYVLGAIEEASRRGAVTVGLSCNEGTLILKAADIAILTDTGAEIIAGSTRLKAGTAQKIVLNAISTCAMAKTGKIYENMMINVSSTNEKLRGRVIRIVSEILSCDEEEAEKRLSEHNFVIRDTVEAYKH